MVSIITPAFNAEEFLSGTVESVKSQTFKDWELIIVDDCSTDNTLEIARTCAEADKRIRVVKTECNGGVSAARNLGLSIATGDYIAFLDSDDLWAPQKLEKQIQFMLENDCTLSYTDFQKFDSSTGEKGKIIKAPKQMEAADILKNTAIGCLTVMVNKRKSGHFTMPILKHTEDNCTWYHILKKTNSTALNIGEVLAYYRVGNVSLTRNKGRSAIQQWQIYREYFKFSRLRSAYYFCCYAFNALLMHI